MFKGDENLKIDAHLVCPKCSGTHFVIKRETTYLYTYKLDTSITEHWSANEEALPFLFDNRDQLKNKDYLECSECKAQYNCAFDDTDSKIHLTILQKAIRSDYDKNPDFLG